MISGHEVTFEMIELNPWNAVKPHETISKNPTNKKKRLETLDPSRRSLEWVRSTLPMNHRAETATWRSQKS